MNEQVFLVFPVVYNVQDLYCIACCIEMLPKNVFCLVCTCGGRRLKFSGKGEYTFVSYEKAEMSLPKV